MMWLFIEYVNKGKDVLLNTVLGGRHWFSLILICTEIYAVLDKNFCKKATILEVILKDLENENVFL